MRSCTSQNVPANTGEYTVRPSISTSSLLAVLMAKPRALMAYCGPETMRHVQVAGEPQRLRDGHHAEAAQIVTGDHRHGRGGVDEPFAAARHGGHVGLGQLFDREALQVFELS